MKGKLIVLEGIDGSGKSTQFKKLIENLEKEGTDFRRLTFPRYSESSSSLLRSYLSGEFGTHPEDVNAFAASTFFFVDRFASFKTDWGEYYNNGGIIISDRYTTSNAIHQGSKLPLDEKEAFFSWLYDFEFNLMGLPKPDLVLYMNIDLDTCMKQMEVRQKATNTKGDIHETDVNYLTSCLETGVLAAETLGWQKINCIENNEMRTIDDIQREILQFVQGELK